MMLVAVHIAAGAVAIAAGGVAMAARKGSRVHRWAGRVFVGAMLLMAASAVPLAWLREQPINLSQALLAAYLVVTAVMTVRTPLGQREPRSRLWTACGAATTVVALDIYLAWRYAGEAGISGMMAVFGGLAALAAVGDARAALGRAFNARDRLLRHLWRMGLALWIACGSFFLGQAKFIPEPIRIGPLLALPVLWVFVMTIYWWIRIRRATTYPRAG